MPTAERSADAIRAGLAAPGPDGDFFALAYIQLCGVAYAAVPADIPAMVADPAQVAPWGDGRWECVWGPALDGDRANLAYVAAYYDRASGLPLAAVAVVRGTDVTDDDWGDFKELFEDLAVYSQVPLPWAPASPARVAEGSLDALATIARLNASGKTLAGFLDGFLGDPAHGRPLLVVTGHSLGGCIATMLAPWLGTVLKGAAAVPIVPVTFAAPTAGNSAFAAYLGSVFGYAPRYFNTLDAVPCGWADLQRIKSIYAGNGLATPESAKILVDLFEDVLRVRGLAYAQPGQAAALQGVFCDGLDWYKQVGAQHDHLAYVALMTGAQPTCRAKARPRIRRHGSEAHQAALGGAGGAGLAAAAIAAGGPAAPA